MQFRKNNVYDLIRIGKSSFLMVPGPRAILKTCGFIGGIAFFDWTEFRQQVKMSLFRHAPRPSAPLLQRLTPQGTSKFELTQSL